MTSIRNFFPSTTPLMTTPSPAKSEVKSIPVSRTDHKLIVSNMKSVINSVKMHKKAKKRKRNRDEPQEINDISKILKSNLSFISPNRADLSVHEEETSKECSSVEISSQETSDDKTEVSILGICTKENKSDDVNTTPLGSQSSRDEEKSQTKANAFEFMMTARHKSIGLNSPGKEISNKGMTPTKGRDEIAKRRSMLEEWAERKGRAKKRLIEAEGDQYIDGVMKKRAKRLKNLLENGHKQNETESSDDEPISRSLTRSNGKVTTKRKNKIVDSDENDDYDDDSKGNSKSSAVKKKSAKDKQEKVKKKSVTDEPFVEKLSSPLKKRDSLYGYFSKLTKSPTENNESPTVEVVSPPVTSTKKRGRSKRSLKSIETTSTASGTETQRQTSPQPILIPDTQQSTEGRPKRLCRDKKVSYFEKDYTPTNTKETKAVNPTKLAPIFAKATPKAVVDPVVLRARQEFLMSGIPEKMKLEIEKQRLFEESYEIEFEVFPKVSHVGYHAESNDAIDLDSLNIRFRNESEDDDRKEVSFSQNKLLKIKSSPCQKQKSNEILAGIDQKEIIKQLKINDTSNFPYYRCFKQLKGKHLPRILQEDDNDASVELITDEVPSANGYLTFTEKYKPTTTTEIVLNSKPLVELRKFLSSWQENEDKRKCIDSDDDFSNSTSTLGMSFNKAVVLTGPPGCGKTTFVYALANEMNFKVLEINAGAKRTGKKVLKKLQEATQSHHVNNNQCSQNDRLNFLKKTNSKASQSDESEDSGSSQKLSLILIEDAEVVFEEDIGFIDSINQLITTTKRPVILITNQINCTHLSRLISRNTIAFNAPKPTMASKWLSTLSVVENCYVTENECQSLYLQNKCDFRKTLLELQFFIQGGVNDTSCKTNSTNDNGGRDKIVACIDNTLWDLYNKDQNQLDMVVPFPVDFAELRQKTNDIFKSKATSSGRNSKRTDSNSESILDSLDFLDMLSSAQWFHHKTDSSDRIVNHLSEEINHFLIEQNVKTRLEQNSYQQQAESTSDIHSKSRTTQLATHISNLNYHSTRSLNLDVEPCLRSICRSELQRSQTERRSSRFYHYLRNANTNSFGTKMFDVQCSILNGEN